jgi:hypothetical protein
VAGDRADLAGHDPPGWCRKRPDSGVLFFMHRVPLCGCQVWQELSIWFKAVVPAVFTLRPNVPLIAIQRLAYRQWAHWFGRFHRSGVLSPFDALVPSSNGDDHEPIVRELPALVVGPPSGSTAPCLRHGHELIDVDVRSRIEGRRGVRIQP